MLVALVATTALASCGKARPATQQPYDFGNPSAQEQQLWFRANRARADPGAEGAWLTHTGDTLVSDGLVAFAVDTSVVVSDFSSYPARPPVAWNARLAAIAAQQAADLAVSRTQCHFGADGSRPNGRVRAAGLDANYVAETVGSYVHSPLFGHAAFQIDWGGPAPTGVQEWPKPGHRFAIMSADVDRPVANVVGMAWLAVPTGEDNFGPNVVVQEFAQINGTFVVGMVWVDANANGEFDLGEGLGGVEIRPDRGSWYGVTAAAGGFVVPVTDGTAYSFTFSGPGMHPMTRHVQVSSENVLVNVELPA